MDRNIAIIAGIMGGAMAYCTSRFVFDSNNASVWRYQRQMNNNSDINISLIQYLDRRSYQYYFRRT